LAELTSRFSGDIFFEKDGEKVNAKDYMWIMMLAAGPGSEITVHASGPGAQQMVEQVISQLSRDFVY